MAKGYVRVGDASVFNAVHVYLSVSPAAVPWQVGCVRLACASVFNAIHIYVYYTVTVSDVVTLEYPPPPSPLLPSVR